MADNTGRYITASEAKARSISLSTLDDGVVEALIDRAMAFIDKKTGQFFNARERTFPMEGTNTGLISFSVPIISIEYIKLNGTGDIADPTGYTVFNGREQPIDHRKNPRIKLFSGKDYSIYTQTSSYVTIRGTITEIKGVFGYLEQDGSTPAEIVDATLAMAIHYHKNSIESQVPTGISVGKDIKREKTDFHEIEFHGSKNTAKGIITGIKPVDDAIKAFKAPRRVLGTFPDSPTPYRF